MKKAIKAIAAFAAFVFAFASEAATQKVGNYTWTYTVTDFDGNTGAVIENGAKVRNLAMDGGTKHLYAIWRLAD